MKEFSLPMALADYIPVILFAIAAVYLMRDLYNKMSKGAFALFSAGVLDIFCAGFLKATYKLLYAVGVCDFEALSNLFFPLQSIGFLLAGIGILAMLTHKQKGDAAVAAVAPPLFSGTFLFVGLMVCGLGFITAGLCILSVKLKKYGLIIIFVLSFICSLCMGYLSSQSFDGALMNWMAEIVNTVGQGLFLIGVLILHHNKLSESELNK